MIGFIYILLPFKEAQNSICRAEIEMQMQRKDLWTQWGTERVGQIERVALTYIHHHVLSRQLVGSCYTPWGAQPGALGQPRRVGWKRGGRLKREGIYI